MICFSNWGNDYWIGDYEYPKRSIVNAINSGYRGDFHLLGGTYSDENLFRTGSLSWDRDNFKNRSFDITLSGASLVIDCNLFSDNIKFNKHQAYVNGKNINIQFINKNKKYYMLGGELNKSNVIVESTMIIEY